MTDEQKTIANRYDFVLIFDVRDGNPNGDPDADNLPRIDPETCQGLVTDVCLKRKVRNYVQHCVNLTPPENASSYASSHASSLQIFVKEQAVLNDTINQAVKDAKDAKKTAAEILCSIYYDVRAFGAVISTGDNSGKSDGQLRGPVQMTFARSVDPIVSSNHTITRCAVTNAKDKDKERTMGRKTTVPYGLYVGYGFVSPAFANHTGFSESDLELFWEALQNMFEHDRSAARGLMGTCKLVVFKHDSALGNAPARKLFDAIKIKKSQNCGERPARSFADYDVVIEGTEKRENGTVGLAQCPGVEVLELM